MSGGIIKAFEGLMSKKWKWDSLNMFLMVSYFLALSAIVIAITVPDQREITIKEYTWLSEQAKAFPEIKDRIYEELSDDGYISNWELYWLNRDVKKLAKKKLLQQLREP